jgi:putative ABC transport system permease protein
VCLGWPALDFEFRISDFSLVMRYLVILKVAFRALRRNKMRTVLTMLGIIIGVGAVIAMVALGRGAKAQVEARIAALGQNVIMIFSGSINRGGVFTGFGGAGTLTVEDAVAIQNEVPGVSVVSPEVRTGAQLMAGENNWSTSVMGEGVDYLTLREWDLDEGIMFGEQDVRAAAKVCILGRTTADKLFPDEDPIGKTLRIKNVPVRVLGILKRKGVSMMGSDQDDTVIVPYTTAMKRLAGVTTLRSINVSATSADQLATVQNAIAELLRQRHRIQAGRDDDFIMRNQQEIAEAQTATTEVMTALLAGVAIISLIVGGIGIMNIMLVSVTERTREIGIRMAVGARGHDILLQFLVEAVTLSSIGGLLGIGLGMGGAKMLTIMKNWPTQVSLNSVVIAFVFSAAVGIFFGFYPARKASQLDPIDALRYE